MNAEPWSIPGYVADQFVGAGPVGDVWTGRAVADGAAVTLEETHSLSPALVEVTLLFARLPPEGHPHLWPVREIVSLPDRTVVVRDRAPGGSLATLLAHRGRLRPGEVVTVVAPLAAALDFLHGERLLHAAITPERILFDADGRPAIAGVVVDQMLGAATADRILGEHLDPVVAAGAEPSEPTDVYMLASCGLLALGGRSAAAPALLLDALTRALHPDPAARPTAAELADAVRSACPPEPVRLLVPEPPPSAEPAPVPTIPSEWRTASPRIPPYVTSSAEPVPPVASAQPARTLPRPTTHDRRHDEPAAAILRRRQTEAEPPRTRVAGDDASGEPGQHRLPGRTEARGRRIAVALLVAGLLVVAGAIWFRLPAASPGLLDQPAASVATATDGRWLRLLDGLDAVRATAYERGDVTLLARVWVAGDRLRADVAQLRALVSSGCTARGVRHRFDGVDVLAVDGQRVSLRVTQWLPASERLRAGRVVGEFAGSPPATVPMDLLATDAGWRLG